MPQANTREAVKKNKRRKNDYYPTPGWVVDELFSELKPGCLKGKNFLEPCKGEASVIYNRAALLKPKSREWCELSKGRDYLTKHYKTDAIITNPPFSLAREFLDKSLEQAQFVAYLLRINFLGSQGRHEWWQGKEPTHFFALSRRPDFTGQGGDNTEYAWFVWDYLDLCIKDPGIHIIHNTKGKEKF